MAPRHAVHVGRAARIRAAKTRAASAPIVPESSPMDAILAAQLHARRSRTDLLWTPEKYATAVRSSDGGRLRDAADFASWLLDDGRVSGAYEQALSFLGKAPRFECDPTLAAQLATDMPHVFAEAEQEALALWGFHFGIGIARAEYVFDPLDLTPSLVVETWDMRWFSIERERCAEGIVDRIYADTETGRVLVEPGKGWIVFCPYGRHEPHKRGLWKKLAKPVLSKQGLTEDRNLTSEVTPLIVGETQGLSEPQRTAFLGDLRASRGSRIVLPRGCKVSAVDIGGGGARGSLQKDGIDDAKEEISIVVNGQTVTTDGSSGFSNGDVQMGVQEAITRKRESKWSTALGEQWAAPWAKIAYGYEGPTPYPRWLGPTNTTAEADAAAASPGAVAPAGTPPSAGASPPVATPAIPPTSDVVGAAAELDDSPDETVDAYARDLTEAESRTCEHGRVNACTACGVERVRAIRRDEDGAILRDKDGNALHAIAWRPLRRAVARTAYAPSMTLARRAPMHVRTVVLAALGDEPPTEFLIFAWGENESSKGSVWMDRADADAIVAEMGSRDVMIDLEHLSIPEIAGANYDPDARGAGQLRIDDVGLWCSNIRWTVDGARRIRAKTQRYTSPAFDTLPDAQGREHVTRLFNVALCANPATRYITPLVAASATATTRQPAHSRARGTMDEKQALMTIAMACGLAADASPEDVTKAALEKLTGNVAAPDAPDPAMDPAAVDPMAGTAAAPDALTALRSAAASNPAALGALTALEQNASQGAQALSRIAALEKSAEDKERAELLAAHANKFPTPEARTRLSAAPIEVLRTFVRYASPVAGADARIAQPRNAGGGDLNEREQKMLAGKTPEQIESYRQRKINFRKAV